MKEGTMIIILFLGLMAVSIQAMLHKCPEIPVQHVEAKEGE